jgi:integrase
MAIIQRKTKTGVRWDVKLRTPGGKQYSRSFRTKREASAFEAAEVSARNKGTWIDSRGGDITFSDLATRWLAMGTSKRTKTRVRDEGIVQSHLLPTLGERPIGTIRTTDIQDLVNQWTDAGLSPATVTRHRAVLSAVFTLAVNDDLLARTPVRGIRMPRSQPSSGRILTGEESARLLAAVRTDHRDALFLLMTTGMRWSELSGLDIRHVDLMSRTPTLNIHQGAHETTHGIEITDTKSNASHRTLYLGPEQVEAISRHLRDTSRTAADADQPLFVSPNGKRLTYRNFHARVWTPAIEEAGLSGIRIHDLRKTAATRLLQAGVDHKTVTAYLGHEDLRTTLQHYAKTTPQSLLEASQRLLEGFTESHPTMDEASTEKGA